MNPLMILKKIKYYGLPILIIFLLCVFAYSNALRHAFLLDDYNVLFLKICQRGLGVEYFINTVNGFYRPLGAIFLRLVFLCVGLNPFGYHVVNLVLFFFICVLFFLIACGLLLGTDSNSEARVHAQCISLFAVCLYCVHPINNMIVNYKTANMLAVFIIFMQGSFLCFMKFIKNRNKLWYILSLIFYFCSLFSHEISIILPLYLIALMYYFRKTDLKTIGLLLLPYVQCCVIFLMIRFRINSSRPIDTLLHIPMTPGLYLSTIAQLLQWYMGKLLLPQRVLFIWDIPLSSEYWLTRSGMLILFCPIIASLYTWFLLTKKRFEIFCLTFFLIGFIPLSFAAFVYAPITKNALIEPHWFYFSSIGFFMLFSSRLWAVARDWSWLSRAISFCGIIIILAIMTRESNLVWKDEKTYCMYWIKENPYNATPYYFLEHPRKIKFAPVNTSK